MNRLCYSLLLLTTAALAAVDHQEEYEYVIIGSGPGGGTLGANLARAGHSVFLLEAGDDTGSSLEEQVPPWNNFAAEDTEISWSFFVNHYKNETQARRDNKDTYRFQNGSYYVGLDPPKDTVPIGILYPRGATLGGSAQVNAMNFFLPPDNDWTYIANLTGDSSWTPENMRRYLVEIERNEYLSPGTPGHGDDGCIATTQGNISFVTARAGVLKLAKEAAKELEGIASANDSQVAEMLTRDANRIDTNRYEDSSVYGTTSNINREGKRSAVRDYIIDTIAARNEDGTRRYPLTLSARSLASRILFQKDSSHKRKPRAYGVEYMVGQSLYAADGRYDANQRGTTKTVFATREVIVAGGSFNTPQILKMSGIGPKTELSKLNIPVVRDLPAVGSYMQDNYEGGVTVLASVPWENNPYTNCRLDPTSTPSDDPCLAQWTYNHTGPYAYSGGAIQLQFRSSVSESGDCDVWLFGGASADFRGFFPGYSRVVASPNTYYWSMVKMQPGNPSGTVTLRSTDPRDTPLINFNSFEQNGDRDLQALSEANDMVMRLFNATGPPYTPFKVVEPTPGIDVKQAIKDNAFSHHVTSSCRMGPSGDANYCVDSKFKLNGVDGLRVVDASIFPRPPGGFPMAPTFLISQKAFHTILDEI